MLGRDGDDLEVGLDYHVEWSDPEEVEETAQKDVGTAESESVPKSNNAKKRKRRQEKLKAYKVSALVYLYLIFIFYTSQMYRSRKRWLHLNLPQKQYSLYQLVPPRQIYRQILSADINPRHSKMLPRWSWCRYAFRVSLISSYSPLSLTLSSRDRLHKHINIRKGKTSRESGRLYFYR
jgi:hypothetical protein